MRILLINPRDQGIEGLQAPWKCYPPLGLLYLAGALEQAGFYVRVVDANAMLLDDAAVAQVVSEERPDLLGLPLLAQTLHQVRRLLTGIRQRYSSGSVVLGGVQATVWPRRSLEEIPEARFVLRGDAERSLVMLCQALQNKLPLEKIPGLFYRHDGRIQESTLATASGDRRDEWRPAKHLVEEGYRKKRYYTLLVRERPVDSIMTSRGCPCRCRFCYNVKPRYATRSAEDVVQEVVDAHSRGIRHLEFVDDNFTLDRKRAMRILALIAQERLGIRLVFKSRPENVDAELLHTARRAGTYQLSFGMESGVQRILDAMGRGCRVEDNARARQLCRETGLECHSSWFFGFPGETPETIEETTRFIIAIKPTTAAVGMLRPYPGTQVYEEASAAGTLVGDWSADSDYIPWLRLPWMRDRDDLLRRVRRVKRKIYFRPYYAVRLGYFMLRERNRNMLDYAVNEVRTLARASIGT